MIYPWLWRHLPGPRPVRVLLTFATVAAMFALCAQLVFPQVADRLEDGGGTVATTPTSPTTPDP